MYENTNMFYLNRLTVVCIIEYSIKIIIVIHIPKLKPLVHNEPFSIQITLNSKDLTSEQAQMGLFSIRQKHKCFLCLWYIIIFFQ